MANALMGVARLGLKLPANSLYSAPTPYLPIVDGSNGVSGDVDNRGNSLSVDTNMSNQNSEGEMSEGSSSSSSGGMSSRSMGDSVGVVFLEALPHALVSMDSIQVANCMWALGVYLVVGLLICVYMFA